MVSAENIAPAPGAQPAARVRSVPALNPDQRRFWIGLACAALLHAMLIAGAIRSAPRIMGEKDGSPEGISVEVIDEADYRSRTTVPTRQQPPPAPPRQASEPAPSPSPPQPAADAADPAPAPAPAATPAPAHAQKKAATAPTIDDSVPNPLVLPKTLDALPEAPRKQPDAPSKHDGTTGAAAAPSKPRPKTRPDLAMPSKLPDFNFAPLSAAVGRPPGITRSGENDDFGRGVVRALRRTMPPHRGTNGRVSIRLVLNENGNIANVQIIHNSGDAYLDQSVLFASKQSSFPLPPKGSTVIDRTFLVTYIYN